MNSIATSKIFGHHFSRRRKQETDQDNNTLLYHLLSFQQNWCKIYTIITQEISLQSILFRLQIPTSILKLCNFQNFRIKFECRLKVGSAWSNNRIYRVCQYGLWSFQMGGTKLERINILNGNYWILRIDLMGRCQKVTKFTFYLKNYLNLSPFFSLKNINLGAHFLFCINFV